MLRRLLPRGRDYDGHQESNSTTTTTQATDINNAGSSFITSSSTYFSDWAQSADSDGTLRSANWSKTDGSSICPVGYRVPTTTELRAETLDSTDGMNNNTDAFNNFLKLPSAGSRYGYSGSMNRQGSDCMVWSSSVFGYTSYFLEFTPIYAIYASDYGRAYGFSVRCIRDSSYTPANQAPNANAGVNQTAYKGNAVTLDASDSSDSDGNITSYLWSENGVILSRDVNFTKYDFSVGEHIVTLQVTDDDNATAEVSVTVTINEFPKELLNANGTFVNNIDFLNSKRVYEFTLSEKTLVTIQTSSQDIKVAGWVKDINGTSLSRLLNWEAGEDGHFAYESILEAGIYTLELFSQTAFASGDFSFVFDTKAYETIVQEPWSINIPINVTYANNEIVSIDLDIQAQDGITLESKDLTIVSDNLPSGFEIIKIQDRYYTDQYSFKLEGRVNTVDDFAVTLNITDGDFSKEHKIYFDITNIIIDGIIGDGNAAKMVIKEDSDGTYKLFKVAFNIRGVNEDDVESVECKFRDNPILSKTIFEKTYYRENGDVYGKYICDIDSSAFTRGASSSEDFMEQFASIPENERFLTVVINFKDGTSVEKKILQTIGTEKIGGYIRVREWSERTSSYSGGTGTIQIEKKDGSSLYYEYQDLIDKEFLVDYGDEVLLIGGRWTVVVGEHELFVNTAFAKCGAVAFKANEDLLKNEILLDLSYITASENLELYAKRTGYNSEGLAKVLKLATGVFTIWSKATNIDDCSQFPYINSSTITAVRGTTFKMTLTDDGIDYDLYEGAIDINDSGVVTKLATMQSYKNDTRTVKNIVKVSMPTEIKTYLDTTSLYQSDLNTTVSNLNISTNLANSSYMLIGDNIRFGNGSLNTFTNISEGNYTVRFLNAQWYKKPNDINITFDENNLQESIASEYQRVVTVDVNNTEYLDNVDINISTANIRVTQLDDESIYQTTIVDDKNSSLQFISLNSTISIDENGTTTTNLSLAKDVKIVLDKYGEVKPTINGVLLPKDAFPLGTKAEVIDNTIRFIVPMNESIKF